MTDFGVSKAVSESTGGVSSLTSLGVALGTPAYMAPEQAAADPHVDHRADIYAVGAMAYEMLKGESMTELLAMAEQIFAGWDTYEVVLDEPEKNYLAKRFTSEDEIPTTVIKWRCDGLTEEQMPSLPQKRYLQTYAETKAMGELALTQACCDDLMTCAVAPHQVYGPRET